MMFLSEKFSTLIVSENERAKLSNVIFMVKFPYTSILDSGILKKNTGVTVRLFCNDRVFELVWLKIDVSQI